MSIAANSNDVQLIGQSEAIRAIEADLICAARSDAKVLITGETGVGKEVVAHLIHRRSARKMAPLVTLNCAGLPDSLLESELFGHTRGSFTGAYRDKPGLLEMAQSGTVFLDEVGEMSTRMQVVLLRFLETGEIQRLGSDRPHTRVNVRLLTATNRDLPNQIAIGAFREDLYFRLNVIRVCIPPLRERVEDIPLLLNHFLTIYSQQHNVAMPDFSAASLDVLMGYRWPGNIRELKNFIERLVLRANGSVVHPHDLPFEIAGTMTRSADPQLADPSLKVNSVTQAPSVVDELTARMLVHAESFWSAVYPLFMARDLTRSDLRKIIQVGLESTNGNYRLLVQLFNMPSDDYKKFLSFLRKHDCHLPFQKFRMPPARVYPTSSPQRIPFAKA